MLDRETLVSLDAVAARLLRLADERADAGDEAGALAATDAADGALALLDLDWWRCREGHREG